MLEQIDGVPGVEIIGRKGIDLQPAVDTRLDLRQQRRQAIGMAIEHGNKERRTRRRADLDGANIAPETGWFLDPVNRHQTRASQGRGEQRTA